MTMTRQLIIVFSILFIVVFAGTLVISVQNTREFLENQMGSHAQDTATSLALSLSPGMANSDMPLMESMVNAIFDPGYYKEIIVTKVDGSSLIERKLPVVIEGVPAWYVRMLPLGTPVGESEIIADWRQAAKVFVRSHPGYAYHDLWRISVDNFWWFIGISLTMVVVVMVLMHYVLRPLRDVESQAVKISNRDFTTLDKLPWTRELKRVVVAMNTLSSKVKAMLSDASDLAEKMRRQANEDSVTLLANRRSFDNQLSLLIESEERFKYGLLCLIEIDRFKEYNDKHGYSRGDELLRAVASVIEDVAKKLGFSVLARIGGAAFAVVLENQRPGDAETIGTAFSKALRSVHDKSLNTKPSIGHIGLSYHNGDKSMRELLSEADMAVQGAKLRGGNAWFFRDEDQGKKIVPILGAQEWRDILTKVIENHQIVLHFQPAFSCRDHKVIHHEVLVRIPGEGGKQIPAGVFVPMAERLNLSTELDMAIVESAIAHLVAHPRVNYSVNLSTNSIGDERFADWLIEIVEGQKDITSRLVFETSEQSVKDNMNQAMSLHNRLNNLDSSLAVDHFGLTGGSFGYLASLKPNYIKFDGSHFRNLEQHPDNQFFLQAVADVAHGLDIEVIAESVETEEAFACVKKLHIDAAQGYYLGRPKSALVS